MSDFDGFIDISEFSETEQITLQHIAHVTRSLKKSEIGVVNAKVYLELNASSLDEIVLSVAKFGQNKRDVPQQIVSVRAEDILFSKFPEQIKSLQWHSYEVQGIDNNKDVTLLASSPITKYQIFKYQNHAYAIQFHIEIKDTTVNEWGCVPEYKKALESQLGEGALDKFDQAAKNNMPDMNNYSKILYENFKRLL